MNEYAKNGTKELYIKFSKWNYTKKLMLGVGLYANSILAAFTRFAGLENDYNWTWALDYAEDKPIKVDLDKEKIKWYIDMLEKTSAHPFISRIFRSWRRQKNDPFYYFLQD